MKWFGGGKEIKEVTLADVEASILKDREYEDQLTRERQQKLEEGAERDGLELLAKKAELARRAAQKNAQAAREKPVRKAAAESDWRPNPQAEYSTLLEAFKHFIAGEEPKPRTTQGRRNHATNDDYVDAEFSDVTDVPDTKTPQLPAGPPKVNQSPLDRLPKAKPAERRDDTGKKLF